MSDNKNDSQPQGKIGFALGGQKKRKDTADARKEDEREYVTSISGNTVVSLNPKKEEGPLVIPLMMNNEAYIRWKKKQKAKAEGESQTTPETQDTSTASENQSPSSSSPSQPQNGINETNGFAGMNFVSDTTSQPESTKEKYGLCIMKPKSNGKKEEQKTSVVNKQGDDDFENLKDEDIPLVWRNRLVGLEEIEDPDEKFRYDVQSRPDEADAEAYESVPVEEFGTALLRGMGWAPGKPIGLNNTGLAEPIEYVRRGFRQGLGADLKQEEVKQKKYIKPGESRAPKPHMVLPEDANGRRRNVRKLSEKLVPYQPPSAGFVVNALVGIVTGPHDGLYGRIVAVSGDKVQIRLEASSEMVLCKKDELCILDTKKLARGHPLMKNKDGQKDDASSDSDEDVDRMDVDKSDDRKSSKSDRDKKHDKHKDRHKEKEKEKHKHKHKSDKDKHRSDRDKDRDSTKHKTDRKEDRTPLWVMPNIVVKVTSKSFQNGKYYSKKIQVVDVASKSRFSAVLDDGKLVEGFSQDHVQTYVPQPPSLVMIVEGPHKGRIGKLLERDDRADKVMVQLTDDFSVLSLSLDSVSQYTGTQDDY